MSGRREDRATGEPSVSSMDEEAVISHVRARAESIKQRELETAQHQFAANGPMSDAQAEILAVMADRLVDRLLAVPERRLRVAAEAEDTETIGAALRLFDIEE